MDGLAQTVAVVTGAASGIGAAIAVGLARAGARVVLTDIDAVAGTALAERMRSEGADATFHALDVTDAAACARTAAAVAKATGNTTVLVNNAGIMIRGGLDDPLVRAGWNQMMQVNVNGAFNVTLAFLPALRATKGTIINLASVSSFFHLQGTSAGYSASKGAVAQLTKALAVELAVDGIRVNAVAPGFIETGMNAESRRMNPQRANALVEQVPLGRWGTPDDVVGPVLFLASSAAKYVTGVVLPVDGGRMAR
ncbi:MAG TPA: glucose 1-dehydrogenase [Burkholderiales bacterium]|nr:glucose 1-dehydrogenase [Burkholderiales bacterium]